MPNPTLTSDPALESQLAQAVDEFMSEYRRGHRPAVEEFAKRHPDVADDLRRVLPALAVLGSSDSATGMNGSDVELGTLGDFRLVREVGRGGMGIVYEAEQISLARRVALKVLPFAATMDPKQLQRFHNEARAAAGLHHEHIVPVYGVGSERGVHFYAMQFIEGVTLAQVIAAMQPDPQASRERKRPEDVTASYIPTSSVAGSSVAGLSEAGRGSNEPRPRSQTSATAEIAALSTQFSGPRTREFYRNAARLIADAADALENAHALGIVHRDVKPANLLVDATGKVWVTDFGLARFGPDAGLTMTGDIVGTLRYMSPEQALAQHGLVDHRTDVYSLGATLYELLTLRPAVDGSDKQEILKRIAFDEPVAPRKLEQTIPVELETVTLKALSKSPADRYATAGDLAEDLRRFVEDRPIQARRASSRERLWRWCRRNPAVAGLLAAVVLVFVVGFAGVTWKWQAAALEAERSRRRLYVSDLNVAHQEWVAGNVARALELLDRQRTRPGQEDLRGFEWRYLWRLCQDQCLHTFSSQTPTINRVTFSPDGKMLAVASLDDSVRLWDVVTRREVVIADGSELPSGSVVAFSADGKFLAVAGNGLVRLWDTVTRKVIGPLPNSEGSGRRALAFAPDGTLLAATVGSEIRLWDVATQQVVGTLPAHGSGQFWSIAFSPDARTLASAPSNDATVRLWDVAARKQIAPLEGHKGDVFALAFAPDGKRLASGCIDGRVRLWNLAKPEEFDTLLASTASVQAVAFSPDGKTLATAGGDGMVRVWDTHTRELVAELRGHTAFIKSIAFAPDGQTLATASWDGTVKLWQVPTQQAPDTLTGHHGQIFSLAFSRDRETLAVADRYGEAVWIWNVATRRRVDLVMLGAGQVHRVAFAPDGQTLAIGCSDKVFLWNMATGQRMGEVRLEQECRSLAFSPDGKLLATGDWKNNVVVWALPTGQELKRLDGANAQFSPDGTLLATGSLDGQVRLWSAATWQPVTSFPGHPMPTSMNAAAGVWGMAFSPDGKLLATSGQDYTARLWDIAKRQVVAVLRGHTHVVSQVAFAPDGKTLATTSWDATVKLWNLVTHREVPQEIATLRGHRGPGTTALAFAPDGNLLASADSSGTVWLWAAASFQVTDDPAYRQRRD